MSYNTQLNISTQSRICVLQMRVYVWNWSYVVEYCIFIAKARTNGHRRIQHSGKLFNSMQQTAFRCGRRRQYGHPCHRHHRANKRIMCICALHCHCTASEHKHTHTRFRPCTCTAHKTIIIYDCCMRSRYSS